MLYVLQTNPVRTQFKCLSFVVLYDAPFPPNISYCSANHRALYSMSLLSHNEFFLLFVSFDMLHLKSLLFYFSPSSNDCTQNFSCHCSVQGCKQIAQNFGMYSSSYFLVIITVVLYRMNVYWLWIYIMNSHTTTIAFLQRLFSVRLAIGF